MRVYHLAKIESIKDLCISLTEDQYATKIEVLSGGSIGQHLRHIIEFYVCLLDGIETGLINYEGRKRNVFIEQNPQVALQVLDTIYQQIQLSDLDQELDLLHELEHETHLLKTSLSRELHYLSEHSIHHFALIKIGIKAAFPDVVLTEHFGVADSTIKYNK